MMAEPDTRGLVAYQSRRTVGFTIYRTSPDFVFIDRLAVHPKHRGQGVGTRLVRTLQDLTTASKRLALIGYVHLTEYILCEWLTSMEFLIPNSPGVVVDDMIEFHWPCHPGSRILEESYIRSEG